MGLLNSFTTPVGANQLPYIDSIDFALAGSAQTHGTNFAYFHRFRVAKPVFVATMRVFVGTASGNIDVGLYTSTDSGSTLTRVGSSGSTAVSGTAAIQSINLTATVALAPGVDYWLAVALDNGTATLWRTGVTAALAASDNRILQKGTSFPLPSSVSSLAGATNGTWIRAVVS